jgi:predicted secreted protein
LAHITGVEGAVLSNALEVLGIDNWAADLAADSIEVTDYQSDGWKEKIAGNKECTGTFEGNWETTQDISADPPALNEGEIVSLKLELQDTSLPLQNLQFDALITNVALAVPQADKIRFTVTFESSGAVVKTFAAP